MERFLGMTVGWSMFWSFLAMDPFAGVQILDEPLMVLIWDWPYGQALNLSGDVCATLYQIEGCQLTGQRSLYDQADVVVFHHQELQWSRSSLPRAKAHPGQQWLWVSLESPSHAKAMSGWEGTEWNWVMTYRQDSDIFIPYGTLIPEPSEKELHIPTKTGLVSWVVSNFHHTQERAQFYHNLSRHIRIDVYGKAVQKPLCPTCLLPTISKYKFYLALENSIHRDYITEKLWRNALLAGAVPVVMGPPRANYEEFLPAEAFVHVDDFSSAKDLVDYLANMNESHYRSFFAWKRKYAVKVYDDWRERFCAICQRYASLPQGKVYPSLEKWFQN
ncbi:alpha-(1,3)-fucosyltransferase 7 [Sceloporus undulatus]|uniref:alpha-(1,3)-fucosyltransferase 7 n=1 Tax=Sceloporus undulatus TaxID=8520 RepID=UPI001C4AB046|nr:alpha-(1,3)-fucosyltransferase 7 [Sceloporus undulatus]